MQNSSLDVDGNVTRNGQQVAVLIILGCQGFIGASAGLFLIVFLASLKEKKPPDFIILGICCCDTLLCFSDMSQIYFAQHANGLGCKIMGVLQYTFAVPIVIAPLIGMVSRWDMKVRDII